MYEDRLNGIISGEEYQKNAKNVKEKVDKLKKDIMELENQKANGNSQKQDDKLDILVEEFLKLEKPTKEIIREFIEKEYERLVEEQKGYPPGTFKVWEEDRVLILTNLSINSLI